jgi:pimeloyl-ACP methyl ester carboxylesterase
MRPARAVAMTQSLIDVGGGITLNVVEAGAGRPVLFCHGFPDVWIGWRRQMQVLAAEGYRAIAVDMRGYGRSSAPEDLAGYTAFHTIGDLIGLLDALELPDVTVVGHDFGAGAAWYACMLRPDRFNAVFAISVPFIPPGAPSIFAAMEKAGQRDRFYMFRQREPQAEADWADAAVSYPSFLYWSSAAPPPEERWNPLDPSRAMWRPAPVAVPPWADADDIAYAVAEFQRTGFRHALRYYRSLQSFSDLGRAFKGLTVHRPSFFLTGEADGLNKMRPVDEDKLKRDLPGLREMRVLPEVGHWPHREAPDATSTMLLEFLRKADL